MHQQGKRLGKNVLLLTIGTFGSKLLTFFLVPLYTSYLSTGEYGVADLLTTTISLLSPLFTVTIGEAVMRFALDKDVDKNQVFVLGALVNLTGFLVLFAVSPILLAISLLRPYYWYFIFYYFTYVLYQFLSFFTKGIDKVSIFTIAGIGHTLFTIITNIVALVIFKAGINGYLLSFIISNGAASLILIIGGRLLSYGKVNSIDKTLLREMLNYSVPMIPNSISWWVSNSSDKYILTFFCGEMATGVYSVAYKIPTILSVCYNIFMNAWRLSAVEDFGSDDSRKFYSSVFQKLFDGLSVIAALIILFNKQLARFMYAKDFYEARVFVPILVLAVLTHGIGEYFGSIYTSAKKTKMLFYSSLIGAVTNIVLNTATIPLIAGMGAAIATFVSYATIVIIRAIHTRKIMKINFNAKKIIVVCIALGIMCVVQTMDIPYAFITSFVLFLLISFLGFKTFWVLSKGMLKTVKSKLSR